MVVISWMRGKWCSRTFSSLSVSKNVRAVFPFLKRIVRSHSISISSVDVRFFAVLSGTPEQVRACSREDDIVLLSCMDSIVLNVFISASLDFNRFILFRGIVESEYGSKEAIRTYWLGR